MSAKPDAPATRRNRDAILAVIADEFSGASSVLEIGSGSGQHAVFFGSAMPWLQWQTSDRRGNHEGINAWLAAEGTENVLAPLELDVLETATVPGSHDAIFSANTAHIMSFPAVECMFSLVGKTLEPGGVFCLYGPFNIDGEFTSESNARFDRSLREQDADMGIRDLRDLERLAAANGLEAGRRYAMPANNMLLAWQRQGGQ